MFANKYNKNMINNEKNVNIDFHKNFFTQGHSYDPYE